MTALSSFLVDHLWQSTCFAAAAWLLTLALKANAARVRYAVWLAASAKFFVPFAALVAVGSQFSWRTAAQPLEANVTVFVNRLGAAAPHELRLFTGSCRAGRARSSRRIDAAQFGRGRRERCAAVALCRVAVRRHGRAARVDDPVAPCGRRGAQGLADEQRPRAGALAKA